MSSGNIIASSAVSASASGYTVSELLTKIADTLSWTEGTAADALKIYQAITACGRAAATWKGNSWWWLQDGTGSFSMVASTPNYTLRTVNSNDMSDLLRVARVYYDDDWALNPISWRRYRELQAVPLNDTTNRPTEYTVIGSAPVIYLVPNPSTTDTINVDYIKFHGAIAAGTDGSLIVPEEYQEGVYVDGPLFLLRRDIGDIGSLNQCPGFVEAMDRMQMSSAMAYDDDPDSQYNPPMGSMPGSYPHDTHVTHFPGGDVSISNQPSL